jgi:hypothetical protein
VLDRRTRLLVAAVLVAALALILAVTARSVGGGHSNTTANEQTADTQATNAAAPESLVTERPQRSLTVGANRAIFLKPPGQRRAAANAGGNG